MFGYALRHPLKSANPAVVNKQELTCLTLSCKLGRDEIFKEMLELSCKEFWRCFAGESRASWDFEMQNIEPTRFLPQVLQHLLLCISPGSTGLDQAQWKNKYSIIWPPYT